MKKNLKYVYYRHPRTRNEMRANQEGWERPRRRPHLLPDTYDDLWPHHEKSWKAKRKTQYHPGGRGKEHVIEVDADFTYEWDLGEYFRDHNIPYRVEPICESRRRLFPKWKRICVGTRPVWNYYHTKKDGKTVWGMKFSHYTEDYKWVMDGHEFRNVVDVVRYRLTWWYDKDVGVDYILNRCRRRRLYTIYD